MAGYLCLMPTAFPSLATRHKIKHLRHFFHCNTTQNQTPTAFSFIKNKNTFCRISEFDNMKPYICNAQLQMMPTAFHPLNPNPFIHYYHGTLPPLFFRKLYRIWPIVHWKCSRTQTDILLPHLQGFRFAPPPACILTPRRGLCGTECRMFQVNCYIMTIF